MRSILKYTILAALFSFNACIASEKALCLEEAHRLAIENSPLLKAKRSEIEMRVGLHIQSKAYPNPIFGYSVENVFGNRHWKGWDAAESRYEFSQPIILGNKREHRKRATAYEYSAAISEYAFVEIVLYNELKKAFLDVVAAQELLYLIEEQTCVADEILRAVQEKLEAGRVSLIFKNKALIEKANCELQLQNARADLESAKSALAVLWGSACPDFNMAVFPFYEIVPPCSLCHSRDVIENHPATIRAHLLYSAAYERVEQEKAERIPDLIVTLGCKTERECHERGMIIGAAIPLPIFDCNEGGILIAESEMCRLSYMADDVKLKLFSRLATKHKEASRSYDEVMQIQTNVLKLAEEAFIFARDGYENGKYEYLDLLDAEKTLFEVKARYIQALLQFLKRNTDIEYLTL